MFVVHLDFAAFEDLAVAVATCFLPVEPSTGQNSRHFAPPFVVELAADLAAIVQRCLQRIVPVPDLAVHGQNLISESAMVVAVLSSHCYYHSALVS